MKMQRTRNVFFTYTVQDPSQENGATHSEKVFPPQLTQSKQPPTNMLTGPSPKWFYTLVSLQGMSTIIAPLSFYRQ